MPDTTSKYAPLPADDLNRVLTFTQMDSPTAQHIGLVEQVVQIGEKLFR